jgi:hypothetical protein
MPNAIRNAWSPRASIARDSAANSGMPPVRISAAEPYPVSQNSEEDYWF